MRRPPSIAAVPSRRSSAEKLTPAFPPWAGRANRRTIFRVATSQTTVCRLPVPATDSPSWLQASDSTPPTRAAELAEDGEIARPPERHPVGSGGRDKERAVGAHRDCAGRVCRRVHTDARRGDGVETKRAPEAPLAAHVPREDAAVARGGVERGAVGTEDEPARGARVSLERLAQACRRHIPDVDAAVVRCGREHPPVGGEREREHAAAGAPEQPCLPGLERQERDTAVVLTEGGGVPRVCKSGCAREVERRASREGASVEEIRRLFAARHEQGPAALCETDEPPARDRPRPAKLASIRRPASDEHLSGCVEPA